MRVVTTVPCKFYDQVAVLSSDGVGGGLYHLPGAAIGLLTYVCRAFCFCSLLVMFFLYPISSILYTHFPWLETEER
jgi:hypothetical protein